MVKLYNSSSPWLPTARVIWLCACARYWPGRGLVSECVTCYLNFCLSYYSSLRATGIKLAKNEHSMSATYVFPPISAGDLRVFKEADLISFMIKTHSKSSSYKSQNYIKKTWAITLPSNLFGQRTIFCTVQVQQPPILIRKTHWKTKLGSCQENTSFFNMIAFAVSRRR